jgi:O-antigen/teichoic acid export membrane protein
VRSVRIRPPVIEAELYRDAQKPPDGAGRVLQNATAIGVSGLASKALLFAWQILLARMLGAEGYGLYGTVGALLAIGAVIPDGGMGLIIIREVSKRPAESNGYLGAALRLQPLLALLGYAVLLLAAALFGYEPRLIQLLALAAASLLIDTFGNIAHNQFIASERMAIPAVIGLGHVLALMAAGGATLVLGGGLLGLYIASLAAGSLRSATYWVMLRRYKYRPDFSFEKRLLRHLVLSGIPLAGTAFISLAAAHLGKLLTTLWIGPTSTGYLTAAYVLNFGVIEVLSTPWLVATLPWMSRSFSKGNSRSGQDLMERLVRLNLLFSLPLAVIVSSSSVPLARISFGNDFLPAAAALKLILWYSVLTMCSAAFAQLLIVKNRQRWLMTGRVIGLIVNIALAMIFIPSKGVQGAVIAAISAELVVLLQFAVLARLPADWWRRIADHLLRMLASTLLMASAILWISRFDWILALTAGVLVYGMSIRASRAARTEDWMLLRRSLAFLTGSSQAAPLPAEPLE